MSRDLRDYARQTTTRLLVGFILLLFLVGDSLIYLIFGREAAILGIVCLLAGISPLILIWLVMVLMEWIVSTQRK